MSYSFDGAFANVNNALANLGKQNELNYKRQQLSALGQGLDGSPEGYGKAALALLGTGDVGSAISFLALGEKARERTATENAYKSSPFATPTAPTAPTSAKVASLGDPSAIENEFVGTVKQAGLTNPVGLGAVAAYGRAESGFSPQNANRTWSDPSQSGQPGTAGGIMSWRADRLQNLYKFAQSQGEQPGNISPRTQALFLAQEDPTLLPKLQAAKTPDEANQIMANAWRFAGYDQPGGENARRLALTQQYAQRYGGQAGAPAGMPTGVQVANNEAEVQRLEAQQGNPVIDAPAPVQPAAPVQMAQAAPMPGQPQADVPAQGANAAGFNIPGNGLPPNDPYPNVTTQQLYQVLADPRLQSQHAAAKQILDNRLKYSDENAPEKRALIKAQAEKADLETRKLRQEVEGDGARPMTQEERKAFNVAEGQAAYIKRNGDPAFGPAGTIIKNEPAPEKGFRYVRDANGQIERMEPIPGSKAEQDQKDAAEKQRKAEILRAETGNVVGNALDDIDRLMKGATLPTTGGIGSKLAGIPGTNAHNIAKALETVGANISFQQLQQMREASPTGGALGAVSDTEQSMLKNSYAALGQSQTEDQFKTNLGRVRAIFERIVHGRTLTPQERKTGGPMTMERAKGLRDQAAEAIAGGAPRDAVLKRLKEDYGITTDGL